MTALYHVDTYMYHLEIVMEQRQKYISNVLPHTQFCKSIEHHKCYRNTILDQVKLYERNKKYNNNKYLIDTILFCRRSGSSPIISVWRQGQGNLKSKILIYQIYRVFFVTVAPLKSSKYRQVNLGQVRCIQDDLRRRRFT